MEIFPMQMPREPEQQICSITTGLVKENWDEDHPGMVKAEYFLGMKGKNVTGWIPVAVPYAYKDCGMYLLPEVGCQVVIGFQMGDRNCPVVLGCLWSQENQIPKDTATEKNTIKRFKTKGGCQVVFEEEADKEAVEIQTPGGLVFRLDEEKQKILVTDGEQKNGMDIDAGKGEVRLFGDGKLVLEVGGKAVLTLDGKANSATVKADTIKIEASKSCQIDGQNLTLSGTQTEVKGQSQLSVQSGGITQIKGAMVKLN